VRIGGTYALERITRDSPNDRVTIGEVLTAFIRTHSPWPPRLPGQYVATAPVLEQEYLQVRAPDVQACLTVLGRAGIAPPTREDRADAIDLMDADLRRARLIDANLEGAILIGAHLEGAWLTDAHMEEANLMGADLENAVLEGTHLEHAKADERTKCLGGSTGARPASFGRTTPPIPPRRLLSKAPSSSGS
jgi:Pentapeptide repeats (8 copies)